MWCVSTLHVVVRECWDSFNTFTYFDTSIMIGANLAGWEMSFLNFLVSRFLLSKFTRDSCNHYTVMRTCNFCSLSSECELATNLSWPCKSQRLASSIQILIQIAQPSILRRKSRTRDVSDVDCGQLNLFRTCNLRNNEFHYAPTQHLWHSHAETHIAYAVDYCSQGPTFGPSTNVLWYSPFLVLVHLTLEYNSNRWSILNPCNDSIVIKCECQKCS